MNRQRRSLRNPSFARAAGFLVLALVAAAIVLPLLWIFRGAFAETDRELFRLSLDLGLEDPTLDNFPTVFRRVPFERFVLNSLIVSGTITIAQLFTASTAAYAFARLRFRGREPLFAVFLASLMVPFQVTMVPLFIMMREMGLYNTRLALILPPTFTAFGVFLLRQHFLTIPVELEEAARVDGAGRWVTFRRIFVPLAGPAMATLGILAFTFWWNDLLMPLVMIQDIELQTLPVGLVLLAGNYSTGSLGSIAAGITMAVVPVLAIFILAQRWIVASVASAGVKI